MKMAEGGFAKLDNVETLACKGVEVFRAGAQAERCQP